MAKFGQKWKYTEFFFDFSQMSGIIHFNSNNFQSKTQNAVANRSIFNGYEGTCS